MLYSKIERAILGQFAHLSCLFPCGNTLLLHFCSCCGSQFCMLTRNGKAGIHLIIWQKV